MSEKSTGTPTAILLLTAVEQSEDSILITNRKGIIEYINPATCEVTGYSRDELIGANPRLFQSGQHPHDFYHNMWKTLEAGELWRGRITNRRKDGSLFTEDVVISPIRDGKCEITHFVGIKRDVTAQLDLEAQLLHAQRMESLARFSGSIAHDFNNLLAVISAYSELLLADVEKGSVTEQDLMEIRVATSRAAALTNQLLAIARERPGNQRRAISLNEQVEESLPMFRRLLGDDVTVEWKPGPVGLVEIDPTHIHQILSNLLINARDAIASVGKVVITTRTVRMKESDLIKHPGARPGEYTQICVKDTGRGIPPEIMDKIFEPFFTSKAHGEGSGLGLSVVHGLVTQEGGLVDVESQPKRGSTFCVYLPEKQGLVEVTTPAHLSEITERPVFDHKILVVEDKVSLLHLLVRLLSEEGFTVLSTSSPMEAIEIASTEEEIDLLITDVVMPELSGKDLYHELSKTRPDLKCLFISGYSARHLDERSLLARDVHFLEKPFSIESLLTQLAYILNS